MFKVSPASLQTFIDTRLTLTPSVIPNFNYVFMASDWNCLKYFRVFFCIVIISCTEIFYHPVFCRKAWLRNKNKSIRWISGPQTKFPRIQSGNYNHQRQRLRWSRGCVLAFSTQVRGFKPGRNRRIFQGEKFLSTTSFGGEVKPSAPCRRFAACKRSLT
jgi:hypothetical protein